jgi:hypothetical protein
LERAYYTCPRCDKQTLFPPRRQTPPAPRSVE